LGTEGCLFGSGYAGLGVSIHHRPGSVHGRAVRSHHGPLDPLPARAEAHHRNAAPKVGVPELGRKLRGLSTKALIEFLETGFETRSLIAKGPGNERHIVNEIDSINELVDKGLMELDVPYEEIQEIFEEKYKDRRVIYLSPDNPNTSRSSPDKQFYLAVEQFIVDVNQLTDSERQKLDDFDSRLTSDGREALQILIKTVAQNI